MSNVLIGIIGVILFIGLALAGAMILGDDFTNASSSSKAAAYISQINQISNAVAMYELITGRLVADRTTPDSLRPEYLSDSYNHGNSYVIRRLLNGDAYIYRMLPTSEQEVCASIQKNYGRANEDGSINRSVIWTVGRPAGRSRDIDCVPYTGNPETYIIYKAI